MPPIEALRAATRNAAELLGESERLGTLAPGKLALLASDLIVALPDEFGFDNQTKLEIAPHCTPKTVTISRCAGPMPRSIRAASG